MSLIKQLWLAIALLMLLAFGGSFTVSILTTRTYMQEQLLLKNQDNANSLASVLGQMPKDPVTIELLVTSQFDLGNYEYIRITDPEGQLLIERVNTAGAAQVPAWFQRAVTFSVSPGIAQVQDGWSQYGTLEIASHSRFAYRAMWRSTLQLLSWFLGAALLAGITGTMLLRFILRPLGAVVTQAEAISDRRFITTKEPSTLEFQTVVRSMNALSTRVKQLLEDESRRLQQLQQEAHFDSVTGAYNRDHFMARLRTVLEDDSSTNGVLVIGRLMGLAELNQAHGWKSVDALLKQFADDITARVSGANSWILGRLNGSDFAVLVQDELDLEAPPHQVQESMNSIAAEMGMAAEVKLPVAATGFAPAESPGTILSRIDAALSAAVEAGGTGIQFAVTGAASTSPPTAGAGQDLRVWQERLDTALERGEVKLVSFPVCDRKGARLHEECVVRMQFDDGDEWVAAGVFLPWVARLNYGARLDTAVVRLAMQAVAEDHLPRCINISTQSLSDAAWAQQVSSLLKNAPDVASKLWFEVPEHGVFHHMENFRALCALLKSTGCRLGIEHLGHQVSHIGELHDLGLDYIKVDAAFVRDLHTTPANQILLRGLAIITHSIGLLTLGEGVRDEQELAALLDLGFDGATGPAIKVRD